MASSLSREPESAEDGIELKDTVASNLHKNHGAEGDIAGENV